MDRGTPARVGCEARIANVRGLGSDCKRVASGRLGQERASLDRGTTAVLSLNPRQRIDRGGLARTGAERFDEVQEDQHVRDPVRAHAADVEGACPLSRR